MTNPELRGRDGTLFGRDRHLRELGLVLDALEAGRGNLVLVAGDAGMGKTRFVEAAEDRARATGVATARVTCWADAGAPPFWPWTELLRATLDDPIDLTEVDETVPRRADLELERFRRFDQVWRELRAAAAARPRLFVIDDLHWADVPSMRLLSFLAPLLHEAGLTVLAAYRDADADLAAGLGAVLPDLLRHGRHLVLSPLAAEHIGDLVNELTGETPPDDAVARIAYLTGGNPLYATELVRLAGNPSGLRSVELPESVRATLTRRLDTVTAACRTTLDAAAVIGVEFSTDLLIRLAVSDDVLAALDEALRARLVREVRPGWFEFSHPLVREAAYRALGLPRRVRMHQHVAEALEALDAQGTPVDPAELSYHFRNAAAGGNAEKALQYAEAAASRAMATLAYETAVAEYEHALDACALCPVAPARRTELTLQLGEARVAAGDLAAAREAFEQAAAAARAEGRVDQLARAALGLGTGSAGFEVAQLDTTQIALLEEALAASDETDLVLRARLLARLSVASGLGASDGDRRRTYAQQAVTMLRDADEPAALAYALSAHCDAIAEPSFAEQRVDESAEIIALARLSGDLRMELLGRRLRVVALLELGRTSEVDAEIEFYARAADAVRQPLYSWYAPLWRGMRALMEARFDDARRWADEAERVGAAAGSENSVMMTATIRLWCDLHTGRADLAADLVQAWMHRWPGIAAMTLPLAALTQVRAGRVDDARRSLDQVRLEEMSEAVLGSEWLECMAITGEAAARLGGHALAAPVYELLLPYRDRFAIDGIGGHVVCVAAHPLALLARVLGRDDAHAHFDAAIEAYRKSGATLLLAQAIQDAGGGAPTPAPGTRAGAFRRDGDAWILEFEGHTARVRHSKGMSDIARLLAEPGRELHALDLMNEGAPTVAAPGIEAFDAQARAAYRRRITELDAALETADARGDAEASERLAAERSALLDELGAGSARGGNVRRTGGTADRARSAVTQRLKDAVARIARDHPEAGRHLRRSLRTGTFCAYEPDGPVHWVVELRA